MNRIETPSNSLIMPCNRSILGYIKENRLNKMLQQECRDKEALLLQINKEDTFITEIYKTLMGYDGELAQVYWKHFQAMEEDPLHLDQCSPIPKNNKGCTKELKYNHGRSNRTRKQSTRNITRALIESARSRAVTHLKMKRKEREATRDKIKRFMSDIQRYK